MVAEDIDSISYAVGSVLEEMEIQEIVHAQYCDKAWLLAKKASNEKQPFDLLICDLSFKEDHRDEKIKSGKELISILKSEYPDLKVLVNSIEDHPQIVKELWESGNIDAYVFKDRSGLKELKIALDRIDKGETYLSPSIQNIINQSNLLVLSDFEINIVKFLANGLTQNQIEQELKTQNIKPSSKSAIEKKLKELREEFNANTNPHLVSIMKDLQLI